MKNMKRILVTLVAAVLLMAMTVAGTLAYLQAETNQVTNTFTAGKVSFDGALNGGLDEAKVDVFGVQDGTTRVKENTYKLLPNHSYLKDPTVHVGTDSEPAWLFVKVLNPISDIEDNYAYTIAAGENGITTETTLTGKIADQMAALGWTAVSGAENVYAYKTTVTAGQDITVFKGFKLLNTLTKTEIDAHQDVQVTIDAYLVQADGFNTAAAAWADAPATWTDPVETPDTGDETTGA